MNTELFELNREERMEKIKQMETDLLFAELDDTIQFDMLHLSNEQWLLFNEKKVYQSIIHELRQRMK